MGRTNQISEFLLLLYNYTVIPHLSVDFGTGSLTTMLLAQLQRKHKSGIVSKLKSGCKKILVTDYQLEVHKGKLRDIKVQSMSLRIVGSKRSVALLVKLPR